MPVLEFVSTIRATRTGPVDVLSDVAGATAWCREHAADLDLPAGFTASEELRRELVGLRQAVRALFARAVAPGPASRADAGRLPGFAESLDLVNATALAVPTAPRLEWPAGPAPAGPAGPSDLSSPSDPASPSGPSALSVLPAPSVRKVPAVAADDSARARAALAAAAIGFLAGPHRERLRACPAPRCVLYFVKEHARQEWCSVACGNRARAARHYRQHRDD
ncbi:CGNR zinc finger domain-containing protein [Streptosporangium sp. NPDC004379]|uniref:CGNR zinc finger domain-containing protein n=1 Tax=Streptosporangium sp. NPDC004379 TaxID=3366189 RepID=UPI0036A2E6A7